MKLKIKKLFKKVQIKEKPTELIAKNKQLTFRTTEYVTSYLERRSSIENRSKSDIINELLDYEAYRYNEKEKVNKYGK